MLKKLTLALTLASAALLPAAADEVVVDGIKYITNATNHTAYVTYHVYSEGSTSDNANYYVGHVTVPETITVNDETYTVNDIGGYAFRTCDKLTGVTLPGTITSIGACGFEHCKALTEVILPASVKILDDWSFANCSSSLHLTLTDVTRIDYNAFTNTTGAIIKFLSNTPPRLDNSSCLGYGNIFIVPDDAKTKYANSFSSVIGAMYTQTQFSDIPALTDIEKTDYVIETTEGHLQEALIIDNGVNVIPCVRKLKVYGTINSKDFAIIRQMVGLTHLDLNEATIEGNTISEQTFQNLSKLESVNLPATITSIGNNAFYGCSALQLIGDMPALETIGNGAFYNCSALRSVGEMPSLTTIGKQAFVNCTSLQSIGDVPKLITVWDSAFSGCTALQSVGDVPNLTTLANSAFWHCSALQSIGDVQNLTTIGNSAFWGCSTLQSIGDMPNLTTIDANAFAGCTALHAIGNMPKLTSIGNRAFGNKNSDKLACISLKAIGDMPELISIGDEAFFCCSALQTIGDMPKLTSIGNSAFFKCALIQTIGDMPALTSIDDYAFAGCTALQSVGDMQELISIGDETFGSCAALQTIGEMPKLTSIGNRAFSAYDPRPYGDNLSCISLQSIGDLPELTTIGEEAFNGCAALQAIGSMPKLTNIGALAFYKTGIAEIYLSETLSNVTTSAFGIPMILHFSSPIPPTFTGTTMEATICVPAGSIDAYRQALPDMVASHIIVDGLTDYDVTVSAIENGSGVLNVINNDSSEDMANSVVNLKVNGTINSYDIIVFRNKMPNLRRLNLQDATIVGNSHEYIAGNKTVDNIIGRDMFRDMNLIELIMPDNAVAIESSACANCMFLTSVYLPQELRIIGPAAFTTCARLSNVSIQEHVDSIAAEAFSYCISLSHIELPDNITYIGGGAFRGCTNLKSVSFPQGLKTIAEGESYLHGAFRGCKSLEGIVLPPLLTGIPEGCFDECTSLKSVSIAPNLKSIGAGAFSGCYALREFRIPAGVSSIGNNAIPGTVKDVYTYTMQPTTITQTTFNSYTYVNATLHVPETSEKLYYWDTQWSQFQTIENFNEPYSYFYLEDKDLVEDPDTPRIDGETDEETGDKKNPDADLGKDSGLIVDGDNSQDLGNVDLEHDGTGNGATIIGGDSNTSESGGNVNVDMLNIKIPVLANKWYFFAFPFDIAMENIKFNGQMVWRYYDGEWRALHGSGSWKNVKDGKLERGKGYIFQGSKAGTLTLSIPKVSFDAKNWIQELKQYVADAAQDASWNFIGNPFQSFYELADLGFDGPITCWNPNTNSYEAYSPLDDDLAMYPFMAFFVQKPEGVDGVEFDSKHRETKNQKNDPNHRAKARKRRLARSPRATERLLITLAVSDGTNSDRTRVVFNSRASEAYEVGVDASKFVSADAPQIYSLDSRNVRYSINERPAGDGTVRLGFYAPAAGTFTIECTRTDCPATLYDAETGKTVTLEAGNVYEFSAKKGYDDGRFVLNAKGADVTSIEEVEAAKGADSDFYGINGVRTDGSRKGVMIEVKGKEAKKVIRK